MPSGPGNQNRNPFRAPAAVHCSAAMVVIMDGRNGADRLRKIASVAFFVLPLGFQGEIDHHMPSFHVPISKTDADDGHYA